MTRIGETSDLLKCSFCGKTQKQVKKLIAGPGVYICDECIDLCNEIIVEELSENNSLGLQDLPKPQEIFDMNNFDRFKNIKLDTVTTAETVAYRVVTGIQKTAIEGM